MTDVKQAIRMIARPIDNAYSVIGTVIAVDEAARTVTVRPVNGDADLFDIRLQAQQSLSDGVVLFPAVDSYVLVSMTSKENGFVAERSVVDKVLWVVEEQTFEFTKDGLSLMSSQAAFADQVELWLDILSALIDTLLQFQLSTNMGPTIAVMPQIVSALNQHKSDLADVKSKLQTMLY